MSKTTKIDPRRVSIRAADIVDAANIRHDVDPDDLSSMKASILDKGVLQNLIAAPRKSDGKYAAFAGRTRLIAVKALIEEQKLPQDYEVDCLIFDNIDPESPEAIEIAMSENMIRSQMDYVDECAAMLSLAQSRRSEEDIAAVFGYTSRTVHERLLIASLIPEALALLRTKTRNLGWARALTIADATMQKQMCDDIAANPDSWQTGEDIRKFLTKSTITASNAIFDIDTYKGEIITDMFEGDRLSDIQQFWTLQNEAIDALAMELEAEGWSEVVVTREPFQHWRFEDSADMSAAAAFIEVMPNGAVNVIRGKVALAVDNTKIRALDEADAGPQTFEEIAGHEVRATPSIVEYAAAHRSAMVQSTMADSFRSALEYSVIAMLGHRNASFSSQPFAMPGRRETQTSLAFAKMADVDYDIQSMVAVDAATPDDRERQIVAMVRSMDDAQLQQVFTLMTAQRVGQQKRRGLDDADTSLMNVFGADIDIRTMWTPDEAFFSLMGSEDLRRLATNLLVSARAKSTRFANAKRQNLITALASNFRDARDGVLGGEVGRSLNAWVPGVMSFPAVVEMQSDQDAIFDQEDDLDALLFGEEEDAA